MTGVLDSERDAQITRYLARIESELADLPAARRREVVDALAEHLDDAVLDAPELTDLGELLAQLGSAADIAAAARSELAPRRAPRPSRFDVAAVAVLLLGGPFGDVVLGSRGGLVTGWLVGVVLLWSSASWRPRLKLLATLGAPLGWGLLALVRPVARYLLSNGAGSSCVRFPGDVEMCGLVTVFPSAVRIGLFVAFVVFAALVPGVIAIRLLRRSARA